MMKTPHETGVVHGFSRIKIGMKGVGGKVEIIGDSGWRGPNQVTDNGFRDYICGLMASTTNSKFAKYLALGTGGAPATNTTLLPGELATGLRKSGSISTVASKTFQMTAEWASGDHTGDADLANIGMYQTNNSSDLFCGNTYTSSTWQSNQGVSATYQLRFATA
jgi:hypothetical protein